MESLLKRLFEKTENIYLSFETSAQDQDRFMVFQLPESSRATLTLLKEKFLDEFLANGVVNIASTKISNKFDIEIQIAQDMFTIGQVLIDQVNQKLLKNMKDEAVRIALYIPEVVNLTIDDLTDETPESGKLTNTNLAFLRSEAIGHFRLV
jgi:hypothetical protein